MMKQGEGSKDRGSKGRKRDSKRELKGLLSELEPYNFIVFKYLKLKKRFSRLFTDHQGPFSPYFKTNSIT